jgi:hypothetical protein
VTILEILIHVLAALHEIGLNLTFYLLFYQEAKAFDIDSIFYCCWDGCNWNFFQLIFAKKI